MERNDPAGRKSPGPTRLKTPPHQVRGFDSNLPWPVTSLIGRERQVAEACTLLLREDVRLLTFIGPGGVGKTQLALAVARKMSCAFADGAVFVSLAPVSDPALVASAVAQKFDVRDTGTRPLLEGLRAALRERDLLLFLDNFEHVMAAAPLVIDLLTACKRLKVLVTSRELLHLTGEHAFDVPPLDLPDTTRSLPIDELTNCDAIRLFVTRAREVKSDFALTDVNADAVCAICRSLDGLPLALELAAARVRVLAPSSLLAQLPHRLPLLTGGHRDAPERLKTMRHAIAWSYDLLALDEQRLFRRLSLFVGGFTFDAAMAVAADASFLDHLNSLIDKSLVQQAVQPDGETRFSMLETIREFGLEQLKASGEEEAARDAHAAVFLRLAEAAFPHYEDAGLVEWSDRVEADLANCHAALEWADACGDAETLARLGGALWTLECYRGHPGGWSRWLERALAMRDALSPAALIKVIDGAAAYYIFVAEDEAQAETLASELLALADSLGDAYGVYCAHGHLGMLAVHRSDYEDAAVHLRQALALAPSVWNPDNHIAWTVYGLASLAYRQGDLTAAATGFADALARHKITGNPMGTQCALTDLGRVRLAQGEIRDAATLSAEALALGWDIRDAQGIDDALASLSVIAVATDQPRDAARLLGAIDSQRLRSGMLLEPEAKADAAQATAEARRTLGDEAFDTAWMAGQKLSLEEATREAYEVARIASADTLSPPAGTPVHGLTPRELEVLRLVAAGHSNREIADTLFISVPTVKRHLSNVLAKLGLPSRSAATAYAHTHRLA
jgi:predicted ATPase/DNA-binding CsgD family transcriptional regulator